MEILCVRCAGAGCTMVCVFVNTNSRTHGILSSSSSSVALPSSEWIFSVFFSFSEFYFLLSVLTHYKHVGLNSMHCRSFWVQQITMTYFTTVYSSFSLAVAGGWDRLIHWIQQKSIVDSTNKHNSLERIVSFSKCETASHTHINHTIRISSLSAVSFSRSTNKKKMIKNPIGISIDRFCVCRWFCVI